MTRALRSIAIPIARAALPRISYPVVLGPLRGARFILGALSGEGYGSSVNSNLVEPEQTLAIGMVLASGLVFFDIGANVGYYSILAS